MVQAIIDGRKSQTRRVISPVQPRADGMWPAGRDPVSDCPYGKPGDRLWVTQASEGRKEHSLEQRFKALVHKTPTCWEWFGRVNKKRYGIIRKGGNILSTHRLAWELANRRAVPARFHVLHRCDLPWCVNPDHLFLGTNDDNVADKVAKGRTARVVGESNGQSVLTADDVRTIRQLATIRTPQKDIAARFGITQPQVSKILSGKRWADDVPVVRNTLGSRWLEVTEVRVQRLQDISEDDAKAEGVEASVDRIDGHYSVTAREQFEALWESINGERHGCTWTDNPWVWAVSFKVAEGHRG